MPKTIRNEFYKNLTYEKLMEAHLNSRKGKGTRKTSRRKWGRRRRTNKKRRKKRRTNKKRMK